MASDYDFAKAQRMTCEAIQPVKIEKRGETFFLDFGRAAFATLLLPPLESDSPAVKPIRLGEKLDSKGAIDRSPPGTIRYREIQAELSPAGETVLTIPPDERNTGPAAVRLPASVRARIPEVLPFRYAEIDGLDIDPQRCRQLAVFASFDDSAAEFESDHDVLNAVWELCRYSIKMTSAFGIYIDGDRERIPYEADAYLNQLSHYCVDRNYRCARDTWQYLLRYPSWPTEWQQHMPMMVWADMVYSGEEEAFDLADRHFDLLARKTLWDLARADGLISVSSPKCDRAFMESLNLFNDRYIFDEKGLDDIVDWPPGSFTDGGIDERDNHEMTPYNSVPNAFLFASLQCMEKVARALGREREAAVFAERAAQVYQSFNRVFFDRESRCYRDGEDSNHHSLHSSMFPLAFGLVPPEYRRGVIEFILSRGMACSVYGAQYFLEGLYRAGEDEAALALLTATHDRSWWNMLVSGSTVTMEAWDLRYKNNL
ncbi:MAG: acetylglucosamine-6-sulfatase, partial [Lentisphaerae bacterium]